MRSSAVLPFGEDLGSLQCEWVGTITEGEAGRPTADAPLNARDSCEHGLDAYVL
jgi:hypothetical protein